MKHSMLHKHRPPAMRCCYARRRVDRLPALYLCFLQGDSEAQLRKGSKALSRELKERTGQLKQLVRDNFDRFTSCKSTIDDIYAKLRKVRGSDAAGVLDASQPLRGADQMVGF